MIKVGITGGIGSGKTHICKLLELMNFSVFYSDAEAKKIQNTNAYVRSKLTELYGEEAYTEEGLNRKFIAEIIFNNPSAKKQLEEIIHPKVAETFATWCEEKASTDEKIVFIESAILYESGFDKMVDKVIVVYADEDVRIERSMRRDGADRTAIEERIKNQCSDKEKCNKADFVLHNNPNDYINKQLLNIVKELYYIEE
ncbi:MAG: dephospho-CoA kinase [Paludibacteraceae bacterium]|nr:dephospho-CoA kinase [Paludibacteraceae bacterium]